MSNNDILVVVLKIENKVMKYYWLEHFFQNSNACLFLDFGKRYLD